MEPRKKPTKSKSKKPEFEDIKDSKREVDDEESVEEPSILPPKNDVLRNSSGALVIEKPADLLKVNLLSLSQVLGCEGASHSIDKLGMSV